MSKTKPHGWTIRDWHEVLCVMGEDIIWTEKPEPGECYDEDKIIPLCLISPDTVDVVRNYLIAVSENHSDLLIGKQAAALLKLLPEE